MLKYGLLGFLTYQPMTGYDLKQQMDESTDYFWNAKQSQIYTTLKAMEQEGLIRSQIEPQPDRPDRRVYMITDAGLAALDDWLRRPITTLPPQRQPHLLKLFFSARVEREVVLTELRLQRELHRQQLERYQTHTRAVMNDAAARFPHLASDTKFWEITRRNGERYEAMMIEWLDEAIAALVKGE